MILLPPEPPLICSHASPNNDANPAGLSISADSITDTDSPAATNIVSPLGELNTLKKNAIPAITDFDDPVRSASLEELNS